MCHRRNETLPGKASARMVGGASPEVAGERDNRHTCMPKKLAVMQVGNSGCNATGSKQGLLTSPAQGLLLWGV